MCGIAGAHAYREEAPPIDRDELLRIREAMERRGPDGAGLWLSPDGRAGLAHRRLAIIGLGESGAQPMATADGRLRITFNGEIYNYRELRAGLERKGYAFRSHSDTEVLLHLYADRGPEMVHALRGMYAFGIWDDARRGLFLARDPFGIKPLYFADDGKTFRFASQVKALLAGGAIPQEADAAGEAGFLTWGFVPEPFTLCKAIRALPAGHRLWIDERGAGSPQPFFRLRDEFAAAEEQARLAPVTSIVDVVDALKDSVRHHLIADVPVAAFLSAGLDSATIVTLASELSREKLRTLTLGFGEYANTSNDETPLACALSERLGVRHETRWVTREEFENDLDSIFAAMDQPSTDGINTYLVSKAAAAAGMKVALSGLGGDELFAGYPSFRHVARIRSFARALRLGPRAGALLRRWTAPWLSRLTSPKYAGLLEYGGSAAGAYLLRRGLFMPWELGTVIDPLRVQRGWEELRSIPALEASIEGVAGDRAVVSTLELEWYMRSQLLRDSDWAGMAHSLEIRVPYVDVQLLRAAMPAVLAQRIGKVDIARALQPALPEEFVNRSKTGFLVPVKQWCAGTSERNEEARGLRGWSAIVLERSLPNPGLIAPRKMHRGSRLAAHVARGMYGAYNGALRSAAVALWPGARPSKAQRICIFRIGNIGDVICALPAMKAIRDEYPHAHITLLTSPGRKGVPGAAEVLEGAGWIDELIVYHADDIDTYSKRRHLLRDLRKRQYDVWIDLPNDLAALRRQFRDMAFAWLARPRWARGWRVDTIRFAAQSQSEYLHFPNEVERMLRIVDELGLERRVVDFALPRHTEVARAVDGLLDPGAAVAAIAPAGKRSTNLWLPARFAKVATHLHARGYRVVLLGGRTDAGLCEAIASLAGGEAQSLAGKLSVVESCEVLRRCSLLVCVDSGLQHMAAAVGTPVVSLFSFWQMLGKWRPHGARNRVIQKWVPCHTCLMDQCPRRNLCMAKISVAEVVDAADQLLPAPVEARPAPRVAEVAS